MKYCILDFETTHLNPVAGAVASVAVVVLDDNLVELSQYYTVVNEPGKEIDEKALEINGLTREELANGKPIGEVLEDLKKLLDGNVVICHNAAFDVAWLNSRGFNITQACDTMDMSWWMWPGQRAKLVEVVKRFGIPEGNAHNSLGDTLMTCEILRKFNANKQFAEKYNILKPRTINFDRWKKR